ncbi:MAG TPA: tetratricopeptide repeat protein [Nitrospiria bacterium]|jgi:tetratricopeptide (TPR) repeat protein
MANPRLWLFRLFAILVVPVILLVFLEGGLRLAGFGYPTTFTIKCPSEALKGYCENNQFGQLFFPQNIAREPRSFAIINPKPPNTYRIFVFGGSAAEGDPDPSYGFSRMLQVMLRDQFPRVNFDVINVGMTAINSHVVYQIAKDIGVREGDLFIIYLGNNEVVGPFGAGTVFSPLSPNLSLIRGSIFVKTTRIGQALGQVFHTSKKGMETDTRGGMEMFLQNQVRADDPGMEKVYQHFQKNLEDILKIANKNQIKTILSTVATNLKDNAPFASLHRRDLPDHERKQWESLYQKGVQFESEGLGSQANSQFLKAAEMDDQFADLQYRLARNFFSLQNVEEARKRYILARDLDTLRFRADSKINEIIRTTASRHADQGVTLLDSVQVLEKTSPEGIPGNDLFYEHANLNFHGNYLLATALFREFEKSLPTWIGGKEKDRPFLTEGQIAHLLAYTGYDRYRIAYDMLMRTRRLPFTSQLDHQSQDALRQKEIDELRQFTHLDGLMSASLQYKEALIKSFFDPWLYYNFALFLENSQNPKGASEAFTKFLFFLPHYYPAHEKLASALIQTGNFDEAIRHADQALQIKPNFYQSAFTKAFALSKVGSYEESLKILEGLSKTSPAMGVGIYNQMGQVHLFQGNFKEAAKSFQQAILVHKSPDESPIPEIYSNLGLTLRQLGETTQAHQALQKAVEEYQKELKSNPNSARTHLALGTTWIELGNLENATQHFQQAVKLNPKDFNTHLNLINAFEVQGKMKEGIRASQEAIQIMKNIGRVDEAKKLEGYLEALKSAKPREK